MKSFRIFTIRSAMFGMFFVAAGVLALLFNRGALPAAYKPIIFSWQTLVCIIGFILLLIPRKFFGGLFLILIGGFFMLLEFSDTLNFLKGNIWAAIAIIVGLCIIFQPFFHVRRFDKWRTRAERIKNLSDEQRYRLFDRYRHIHHRQHRYERCHFMRHRNKGAAWRSSASCLGHMEYNAVFGGAHEKISIKNFMGGEINCVFGGAELDLSDAQLAEGIHTLEINTVFGGVVLYIPVDWCVEIRQSQLFGHFSDNRPKPPFEVDEKRMLLLEVTSVFGGGEVKVKHDE
jgi:predicted membrane protein